MWSEPKAEVQCGPGALSRAETLVQKSQGNLAMKFVQEKERSIGKKLALQKDIFNR